MMHMYVYHEWSTCISYISVFLHFFLLQLKAEATVENHQKQIVKLDAAYKTASQEVLKVYTYVLCPIVLYNNVQCIFACDIHV